MDRTEYNKCMSPWMKGSKSKEERKASMCVGAKLCTGKASTEEEAKQICLSEPPKQKSAGSKRKIQGREAKVNTLFNCLLPKIDMANIKDSLRLGIKACASEDLCSKRSPKTSKTKKMRRIYYDPDEGPPIIPDGYEK